MKFWNLLLLIPIFAYLWVPFYAKQEPAWLGIPFFYWYQTLWILLTSLILGMVYVLAYRRKRK